MAEEMLTIDVGPIWDNNHAKTVAADWLAKNPGHIWKGDWRTVVEGQQSVIEVFRQLAKEEQAPLITN